MKNVILLAIFFCFLSACDNNKKEKGIGEITLADAHKAVCIAVREQECTHLKIIVENGFDEYFSTSKLSNKEKSEIKIVLFRILNKMEEAKDSLNRAPQ
jgi:hypothetical protein